MRTMINLIWSLTIALILFFASAALAQESKFTILPGDLLHINVWKEEGLDQEVLVLPDGTITFPLVGTLNVRNMSPADLQTTLRTKLQPFVPTSAVTVSVKAPTGHKVSVVGQVQDPGEIILSTQMGVMQALSQVGGLTPYADEDEIIIIRETPGVGKQTISYPYSQIAKGKELEKDLSLVPGDVVMVPAAGLF